MTQSLKSSLIAEALKRFQEFYLNEVVDAVRTGKTDRAAHYEQFLTDTINITFDAVVEEALAKVNAMYKHKGHEDHSDKDEWYACIACMDDDKLDAVLKQLSTLKESGGKP